MCLSQSLDCLIVRLSKAGLSPKNVFKLTGYCLGWWCVEQRLGVGTSHNAAHELAAVSLLTMGTLEAVAH